MQIISNPDKVNRKEWSDFVYNHPNGNVFQTPEMFEVYNNTKYYEPVFLAVITNNKISALLLAVVQKEYSGILGNYTARSIVFGGPLFDKTNLKALDFLLKEYDRLIGSKAIYTQFRNFTNQGDLRQLVESNGYSYIDHLNIILDLNKGKDNLWRDFSKSRKKGILKAISENFLFESKNDLNYLKEFYRLLSITYNRIKLPVPHESHFIAICNTLSNDNYQIFTISKNGKIVVALFTLIFKNTILGYYMGSIDDHEIMRKKPIDLLFWEVFKWSIERRLHFFDWMGAGKPDKDYGVRDFKLQYSGATVNLGRFEKIHRPLKMKIANVGIKVWRKLK